MVRSHLMPVVIGGPTGSGKSALALTWATRFRGEIICADSRQFYTGMSIGTASPTKEEMDLIPHHGFGIVDPLTQKIDAGFFVQFALRTIQEVQHRENRPILVGGTGLYLRALYYGMSDVPKSSPQLVTEIAKRGDEKGVEALYKELKSVDPETAHTISLKDRYRITRALEIYYQTGQRPSMLRKSFSRRNPELSAHWVYKNAPKSELQKILGDRVKAMYQNGLIEEARLIRARIPLDSWVLKTMGYEEALKFLDGHMSIGEAIERTLIRHRQYAKRQLTWFNKEPFYRFVV
jgi:tRNA dimethylallyltransferase